MRYTKNSIIRLERAGNEHKKTITKLLEAVVSMADKIVAILDAAKIEASGDGINLNLLDTSKMADVDKAKWGGIGCYYYRPAGGNRRSHMYIGNPIEESSEQLDSNGTLSDVTRENALMFSRHVANGLLTLISQWLENRTEVLLKGVYQLGEDVIADQKDEVGQ